MNRPVLSWGIFGVALAMVLAVMLFLTVKTLEFERNEAAAANRAAMEETIRLALWRMDSAAAVLLAPRPAGQQFIADNNTNFGNSANTGNFNTKGQPLIQRNTSSYQQDLSKQEWNQRARLNWTVVKDWHTIEPALLERIADILPGAKLEAVSATVGGDAGEDTRRLASIPARLVVPEGALGMVELPWDTPLRSSLMIAWACLLLAAAAVALLLRGALSLSERRGAFVSAVTHELRTPLTTFKMYADMLATGMVTDPAARQQYLDTLVSESDRLGHLIENVLAYARLERRIAPSRAETLSLARLLERITPALQRRAEQAGAKLLVTLPESPGELLLRADALAVHQVLLNLIDNACKYGQSPIELSAAATDGHLRIRVADHGPGLAPEQARRLFKPFSKSATSTAPGIGLGLFLSRRLARDLGGDLQCDRSAASTSGAAFVLTLPLA